MLVPLVKTRLLHTDMVPFLYRACPETSLVHRAEKNDLCTP